MWSTDFRYYSQSLNQANHKLKWSYTSHSKSSWESSSLITIQSHIFFHLIRFAQSTTTQIFHSYQENAIHYIVALPQTVTMHFPSYCVTAKQRTWTAVNFIYQHTLIRQSPTKLNPQRSSMETVTVPGTQGFSIWLSFWWPPSAATCSCCTSLGMCPFFVAGAGPIDRIKLGRRRRLWMILTLSPTEALLVLHPERHSSYSSTQRPALQCWQKTFIHSFILLEGSDSLTVVLVGIVDFAANGFHHHYSTKPRPPASICHGYIDHKRSPAPSTAPASPGQSRESSSCARPCRETCRTRNCSSFWL